LFDASAGVTVRIEERDIDSLVRLLSKIALHYDDFVSIRGEHGLEPSKHQLEVIHERDPC
jgi:hypothetical protein